MSQLALALADRNAGGEATLAAATAAHRTARELYERHLAELIREHVEFTADTIRERAGNPPDAQPNLLPWLLSQAAQAERIQAVGEYRSPRRTRHGSRNRRWIATDAL
ncbi:hypothetical protein SAMN04487905_10654 [Actinopolyspora xinjiangensis]|uniref:Uncharacterized protein n=1 Tax=Actinopolyspora xinjiangensis TaxID=405564 RepID=A0A1H0U541_9ACTN|nr:hypothetical protein [Actinopolyspora xinjiangensis]SDP61261.1 hypothetical protein SAMN04487905_10654 [Actinopolyspora xinjiangensis]